jgi:PAS domain S-box-containing protein
MSPFTSLGIKTKFNIIMILFMIGLFVVASIYNYRTQQTLIIKGAVDNARIIAREIIDAREYMSSVVKDEPSRNYNLVPQVVATQVAKKITGNTQYYVRQVSLRYRNPENRPDDYETQQLTRFKEGDVREVYNVIETSKGRELRYMLPMRAEKSCLECHGSYDRAPKFVQARFPRGHISYNYQQGEVIGAVSVMIPMASLYREVSANVNRDIAIRGGIFLVVILLMGILISRTIITPITLVARSIARAARTGTFTQRLPVKAKDEVGELIVSFNEMMEELERKIQQSRESEDRYRNFIKMAQSAVVTFMEDGKIVISNERAEKLLGLSRQDLLGENFFDFIEDGEELRRRIEEFIVGGAGGVVGETATHRVLNSRGTYTTVEIALSASSTEGNTMLTAILREMGEGRGPA